MGRGGRGHKALIEAAMHHLCFIQTADAGASNQAAKQGTAQTDIFSIQFNQAALTLHVARPGDPGCSGEGGSV